MANYPFQLLDFPSVCTNRSGSFTVIAYHTWRFQSRPPTGKKLHVKRGVPFVDAVYAECVQLLRMERAGSL